MVKEGVEPLVIKSRFDVSLSTVKRIEQDFKLNPFSDSLVFSRNGWKFAKSEWLLKIVEEFIKQTKTAFTARSIQIYIRNKVKVLLPLHKIRNILKSEFHLSFKKGSSRRVDLNIDKMRYSKSLFTIEFIKSLSEADIILNLDESTISRSTKWEYSWLKTGENGRIHNDRFSNSVNVISVASNSGWTFTGLWHTTTTRHIFINFLKSLKEFIQTKLKIPTQRMIMILDNASVHQCKESRAYMEESGWKVIFIPSYSPELAPI